MEYPGEQPETFTITDLSGLNPLALIFLEKFPQPGVFMLEGEMGAGKTTFVKAICKALDIVIAGSPTFSLVNEYTNREGVQVLHFDLYRVKTLEEALDFGFEEYLERKAYVFIEWPGLIFPLLPANTKSIRILDAGGVRKISF